MTKRIAAAGVGLALALACLPATGQTPPAGAKPAEITLVGCVDMEKDYRARKEAGRGGVLGTGVGVGNEFVLSNARPARGRRGAAAGGSGVADYEVTGRLERDFLRHVGRQVEVIGTLETNADGLARINVTLWHPVDDYCPSAK